jgi:hypothetical protein
MSISVLQIISDKTIVINAGAIPEPGGLKFYFSWNLTQFEAEIVVVAL